MDIVVDERALDRVFGELVGLYNGGDFPFDQPVMVLPQDTRHLPKTLEPGSREHALFLFHACYWMRGGIDSNVAFRAHAFRPRAC